MDSRIECIVGRLTNLYRKEYELQRLMRNILKEPSSLDKAMMRINYEFKLKKLRKDIEQEEYNLQEFSILQSLEIN